METAFSILHVVTAVFLVGPMAILPMVAMRDLRTGNGAQAATLGRSTFVFSLASLLVIVFGFGLTGMSEYASITTPWVLASLIVYLVALALTLIVVVPALRGAGESSDSKATYTRVAMSSGIATLLLLAAVVLMVWKP